MKALSDGISRALTLVIAIAAIALFALAASGCGDDKQANADAPGGATAAGGSGQGENGSGSGGSNGSGGSGESSKSDGAAGGGSGDGGSGARDSDEADSGDSGAGDGGAGTNPGAKQNSDGGSAIQDNNSVDDPAASDPPKKLSAKERAGLGTALGQAEGAAREYLREPLSKGWFRSDSNKIDDAIDGAEFVAPYIKRKLMLAAGSMQVGQSETLRRDLTAAFAMFSAFEEMRKTTAGRRVYMTLNAMNQALRTARRAGVKIDVDTPTRSEIRRES